MIKFKTLCEKVIELQTYRWLSILQYRMIPDEIYGYQADKFFEDLIASPAYHKTYLGPDSWENDPEDVHGPFSISKINKEHYLQNSRDQFIHSFLEVLNDPGYEEKLTEQQTTEVLELINSFAEDLTFYKFERQHFFDLDEYPLDHDWSFVLWEFVEFLVVDYRNNLLYILVLGFD